jgi:hypothetical protein
MLTVNGAQTLLDELKFGGTIQFMVRPEPNISRAQTILRYGSPNTADTHIHVQLTPLGLLDVSVGPYRYTTTQALPPAWNQISINFGADGFSYFQNGIEIRTRVLHAPHCSLRYTPLIVAMCSHSAGYQHRQHADRTI